MIDSYAAPAVQMVGTYSDSTQGLWFGKFRDIFGGKAIFRIIIEY